MVRIGVLDSNGAFSHPFFKGKRILKAEGSWKGQEYSVDSLGFSHGEYVCSFILKENPDAEIVLVPIIGKNRKCSVKDMIEGIAYLIQQQVDIINLSLGDEYKYHVGLEKICYKAVEHGIFLVSAFSNREVEYTYPASFSFVLGTKCLDMAEPLYILKYSEVTNAITFSSKYFSLYHLGIPKLYQGNSFACAVVSGFLSNYKDNYRKVLLDFSSSIFNQYYPYKMLKEKKCCFLTNRIADPLEQRFMREVTDTVFLMCFEEGMERVIHLHDINEKFKVLFIDHDNYTEICKYKSVIQKYVKNHPEQEIVLRYPLFNLFERISLQKKTKGILNQFFI